MKLSRKLLQHEIPSPSTATFSPDPLLNTTEIKKPFTPNAAFDSSMALTVLILVTALFFLAFFSVYLRRLSYASSSSSSPLAARSPPVSSASRSCFSSKGLDASTVGSLPLVAYGAAAEHPIDCVICLTEFEVKETVKMIPHCRHVFHPSCIDTWLSSHVTCPLCRSTRISVGAAEGVCSGVAMDIVGCGVSEVGGNSTVDEGDTWREVGSLGVRRTCSYSSLGNHECLHRSTSF